MLIKYFIKPHSDPLIAAFWNMKAAILLKYSKELGAIVIQKEDHVKIECGTVIGDDLLRKMEEFEISDLIVFCESKLDEEYYRNMFGDIFKLYQMPKK